MPESSFDDTLEQLLAYEEPAPVDREHFVNDVMGRVRRQQRKRRLVLLLFGAIGAIFGLAGGLMLADPISWVFTQTLSPTLIMQAVLFTVAGVAFYVWFMNDDLPLED
jgi:uncharacterized protein YacL